ncbi:POT family proton-dependent oligopeptide transporter [Blastomyces silverae]|uniref:POT family proton-dependent oligopeptide transporter n=1 Tax=Blastomyces silverae TaxID=2060906 RepID=A0A0H1B4Y3_9EURO|nr:POT family proton-dependent oligopeptide transporter [Blastomyces silverae]
MTERLGDLATLHAIEVEPRVHDHHDLAGGDEPIVESKPNEDLNSLQQNISSPVSDVPIGGESATLRKVPDKLPWSAFLVAVVELCERFAYYGLSGPFQNYIQNPYKGPGVPGALGLGQSGATGLASFFQFWSYLTPVLGAIVADQYLGRFNTIVVFSLVYMLGLAILFCTSLPVAIEHGAALGGLVAAMIVIGLGTGGIKANIAPLIGDQIQAKRPWVKTLKSGEQVIVDPALTVQRVYMIFYLCINIGSLAPLATTELELHIDFWAAYLLPLCMFVAGFSVLIFCRKYYVVKPPKGSVIIHAFKALWIGFINKGNMNAAKASYQAEHGGRHRIDWDDHFVEELKRALVACKVFVFFPIYWACDQQMLTNFVSQAATMELHGVPNDFMQNIVPLTIIIFIPVCDRIIYPLLRRIRIPFKPMSRITMGFLFGAAAMAYAAIIQRLIYSAPPCFDAPRKCPASHGGALPNRIHVAAQTPAYLLVGFSEIFASITGLEYAYTKAPATMKSFVMALYLMTIAFGAAVAIALSPTARDPNLVWMYTGLAVACFLAGVGFWLLFRRYNATEEAMNALEIEEPPSPTYGDEKSCAVESESPVSTHGRGKESEIAHVA